MSLAFVALHISLVHSCLITNVTCVRPRGHSFWLGLFAFCHKSYMSLMSVVAHIGWVYITFCHKCYMSLTYVVAYVGRICLNFITNVTCSLPAMYGQEVFYRQSFCTELSWKTFSFTNCFDVGKFWKYYLGKPFSWEKWECNFQLIVGKLFCMFI